MKHLIFTCFAFSLSLILHAQNKKITGIVIDEKGEALPGATVILTKSQANKLTAEEKKTCNQQIGTITDIDGNFELMLDHESAFCFNAIKCSALGCMDQKLDFNDSLTYKVTLRTRTNYNESVNIYKPAIYLYPTQKAQINITHDFKGDIGTTYPAYNTGWHVIADPNGSLFNMDDHRNYEYLFWDGIYAFPIKHYQFKDGFVVPKEKLQHFLLEKLSLVGMNNKEINDFIVYWLPVLNKNDYNFIHFRINDDIDHSSVLHVNPEPDSRIRLFMEFKEVEKGYTIPTQQLQAYPRKGFTLVEWGGGKIEQVIQVM